MIAALYVDLLGPYPALLGFENCWDASRDAREYSGRGPIVAHPPCGPWCKLKHQYQGAEHDCAIRAVTQVRAFGGVLEQPAGSKLWDACALPRPGELPDALGGYSIAVNQCDFGHVARKPTWLYLVGVPREAITLPPAREPTHWASGSRGAGRANSSGTGGGVPPGMKVCSAQQRRRTPIAFAQWLIALAELAR